MLGTSVVSDQTEFSVGTTATFLPARSRSLAAIIPANPALITTTSAAMPAELRMNGGFEELPRQPPQHLRP
jgi:hypothetical protein